MGKCIPQGNQTQPIAYLVKSWPRLSETFILNEVLAMERRGVSLRIFSVKDPNVGPVHARVAQVRAEVTYLSLPRHWKPALQANLRLFWRKPGRYCQVLLRAILQTIRHFSSAALRHFLKAGYLADVLLREPVAHLHAHFVTSPALIAMFTHQLIGIPYTLTAHAKDIYLAPPDRLLPKLQQAQAVITCTEFNRRHLMEHFGTALDGKLHCIHHGLDLFQFKFRRPPASDLETPLILCVARLVPKKGLQDLILAADILRRRERSFKIEIIGNGPLRETLENQVTQLGLNDQVKLLGALPHEVVCGAYQRACMFVLPCVVTADGDRDGIPNVLLEAMASGVPVISTMVSGIPELIDAERNGLLVRANSPAMLAEAIDRLLSCPELSERLVHNARKKIEASFSMDHSTSRLLALFQRGTADESPSPDFAPTAEHWELSGERR
jgi:glycosyltransferase involved in cell wall biosynthesis